MTRKICVASMLGLAAMLMPGRALGFTTYYQCANKATGDLRAISPGAECRPNEDPIQLNVPEVIHGSVIGNNAYTNGARGFTYTSPQPGQYVITFSLPLSSAPDCVADIINPAVNAVEYCDTINTTLSAAGVAIACWSYNPTTGSFALANRDFTFMCVL
ncbi:hypothetical protein [Anaeromyxobacter sp. Fw109-5]|uniref:hypothetical protein n=1 Tax=Anaeromyxobacter sp. (strain Fw109-5) TaxID=404589 RepID=UPI0000ED8BC9|nr:hypothetical protein [Anaeromyxobacter sp. Fw109-5]ABS27400.1 hypothetical protein Anae109_3204 [Anaeromyxobacter sp. Fw109-5]